MISRVHTNEELVEAVNAGDSDAFSTLLDRHRGAVFKLARRRLPYGRFCDLDDAYQEACIALWDATRRFDPAKGKFLTYAWRCIDLHLRRWRSRQDVIRNRHCFAASNLDGLMDDLLAEAKSKRGRDDVDEWLREAREEIAIAIRELPENRQAIVLERLEGKDFSLIAAGRNRTRQNVQQIFKAAMKQLGLNGVTRVNCANGALDLR